MAWGRTERLLVALDASGLLEHVEAAVLATSLDGVILYANPYCEVLYGRTPAWLSGKQSADYAVDAVPEELRAEIARAILAGKTWEGEFRVHRADGELVALHAIDSPLYGDDGTVVGVVSLAFDVTEQRDREDRVRQAAGVAQFLADAGEILGSSLDYPQSYQELARVCVPFLADLCMVDVADGHAIRRMAVAHADPTKQDLVDRLARRYAPDPFGEHPAVRVIQGGPSEIQSEVSDELIRATTLDEEHYEIVRSLEITSYMSVPLIARGTRLGALTLVSAGSGRRFGPDDLVLAEDFARRAALALDNTRLYAERTRVAQALQANLLPPSIPDVPGIEVAARYRPAGTGHEVGGDFYDVFEAEPGRWVVAIGDVSGKGPEAGAVAGLARHTLRAASLRERVASRVLELLHEALLREETADDRFCTVCLALVAAPARRGIVRRRSEVRVAVSCGGHPPPIVVRRDGTVRQMTCVGTLLGMTDTVTLTEETVRLRPGDALVLYTDGVTEAQDAARQLFGEERLVELLVAHAAESAATIADRVLTEVSAFSGDDPRDDIAIVVLRVEPSPSARESDAVSG